MRLTTIPGASQLEDPYALQCKDAYSAMQNDYLEECFWIVKLNSLEKQLRRSKPSIRTTVKMK